MIAREGQGSTYHGSLLLQVGLTSLLPLIPARHLSKISTKRLKEGYQKRHWAADPRTSESDKPGVTEMSQGRGGEFGMQVWEWSHLGRLIGFKGLSP